MALDDESKLVVPGRADKGRIYRCPQCAEGVILRKGEIRRAHFAHATGTPCSPESVVHRTAKLLIATVVRAWIAGGPAPQLVRRCPRCDGPHFQPLPERVEDAAVESALGNGCVPDVLMLGRDRTPLAAVELLATHAVDEAKRSKLTLPWVELVAAHVVQAPLLWLPVQDHLRPFRNCASCASADSELASRYDATGYLAKPHTCYRCHAAITVYTWRGKGLWDDDVPPKPIPQTVQHRYSHTAGGRYWVNTCPGCRAIQGDWHLTRYPGPFSGHAPDEDVMWRQHCDEQGIPPPRAWTEREARELLSRAPTSDADLASEFE
jgi:hypothetical protein